MSLSRLPVPLLASMVLTGLLTPLPGFELPGPKPLHGQELPPRVELPPPPPGPCEIPELADRLEPPPGGVDSEAALRLMSEAGEAAILGDEARARVLLEEAAAQDPSSPEVAYRLGRILETAGDDAGARREFCGYLALEPGGPDAAEVEERLQSMAPVVDEEFPPEARAAFSQGIDALESGDHETAVILLSRALVEAPNWADAHYNRGLAYLGDGRIGAGTSDLERYLELSPEAEDRRAVEARLRNLRPVAAGPSPRTALVTGLLVPGMGQILAGGPGGGFLVLAAAGVAAGVGILYQEMEVRCRVPPSEGVCPPDQVAEELSERPWLVPGLAAAGVITVVGAVQAWRGARPSNPPPGVEVGAVPGGGVELRLRLRF